MTSLLTGITCLLICWGSMSYGKPAEKDQPIADDPWYRVLRSQQAWKYDSPQENYNKVDPNSVQTADLIKLLEHLGKK